MTTHFILYVSDQQLSKNFYEEVLAIQPRLNVPGMTEFQLSSTSVLGLMPIEGIKRLLSDKLPLNKIAAGILKAELYLMVDKPEEYHERALKSGAVELSPLQIRDWGHTASYCMDQDGNVIAFAKIVE
ncbi:MAG: hypothetical protein K9J16_14660 [Melioribacteraceae bacterium]|nr:hypothetical protein [Melioribacteraceae bacterium]MCF8356362.1 hypothetical protein [Melioribacteraceae bacterium]MCF8395801.1 hypothetical protein [Melioribacteraceae bacterium]MCF8420666.1 hypothetical protein [Melioribacteraceae bacterium]